MACIEVEAELISKSITADAFQAAGPLSVSIGKIAQALRTEVTRASQGLSAAAINKMQSINVSCSIICSLDQINEWMEVTPSEIQWITNDVGVFFEVRSNVDWVIVKS